MGWGAYPWGWPMRPYTNQMTFGSGQGFTTQYGGQSGHATAMDYKYGGDVSATAGSSVGGVAAPVDTPHVPVYSVPNYGKPYYGPERFWSGSDGEVREDHGVAGPPESR